MKHIEYLSNGMGSQSMLLLYLAATEQIPATVSITADTGGEDDCLLSDGTRCTAREFFENHILPYAHAHGIEAYFPRVCDKNGEEYPPLQDKVDFTSTGKVTMLPVYGSRGGQNKQSCTQRYKTRACSQQLRRLGATSARGAIGIHVGEAWRRVKGECIESPDTFTTYRYPDTKWLSHYYPLVDLKIQREQAKAFLDREGIVYVQHSQCSFCPHQDWTRWSERSAAAIQQAIELEATFQGKFFLTDRRKPLQIALAEMRHKAQVAATQGKMFDDADFGCDDVCGI